MANGVGYCVDYRCQDGEMELVMSCQRGVTLQSLGAFIRRLFHLWVKA